MGKSITWVGLDAHKKSITVARLTGRRKRAEIWTVSTEQRAVRRLVRKLRREVGEGEIRCCCEAVPLGYVLQRWIEGAGGDVICEVVAPSLIPVEPGERIKTDRRDAQKLAELFRGGMLTEVRPPTASQEAVRDLCRCRVDAKQDQLRSRHRLKKFLLRRGLIWNQGFSWTLRHMAWLRKLEFEEAADRVVFQEGLPSYRGGSGGAGEAFGSGARGCRATGAWIGQAAPPRRVAPPGGAPSWVVESPGRVAGVS